MIAEALKHMLAAGMPHDAIVAAVSDMEASLVAVPDPVAERRRAYDRERKRVARMSGGNPVESADSAEIADAALSLDKSPQTPKINPTPFVHTHETRARPWPCPDGVDPKHWADFLAARKRKKCVTTETAHRGVLNDLERLADDDWPPGKLVEHAAAKGWASINYPSDGPPRNAQRNGTANGMGGHRGGGGARVLAAGSDFVAGAPLGSH